MNARALLCHACAVSLVVGQQMDIAPLRPVTPIIRWYEAADVPPVRLANSPRLRELVRGGVLYLTVQDAIALALENNIDIEVARYNPLIAASQYERFQAGGALPGVPSGASQAGTVAAGQGVAGSEAAAGVVSTGGTVVTNRTVNATITQIGPVAQALDPTFSDVSVFSHTTTPQFNGQLSVLPVLIDNTRVYSATFTQGFITGGSISVNYIEHYLRENAPTDFLNPSLAPNLSVSFQHNLLSGFGVAVNSRNIRVQRVGLSASDLNFRTEVISIVSQTLDRYYGLVADYEDLRAKQRAVDVARTLAHDTAEEIRIGTVAPLEQTTADSQVAASERDLVDSQTALQQQELQLKNLLSRTGTADPVMAAVRIVPLDRIAVPATDDLPPLDVLIHEALAKRSDLASERLNITSAEISAIGTRNGLLPTAQVLGGESQAGLSGVPKQVTFRGRVFTADPYFAGGIDNAVGQIFRHNFPSEHLGGFAGAALRNRQAQADYSVDQLQLRQTQLTTQKDLNQVQVDIHNYVVAMRQARARYDAAVKNVDLEQRLFDAEKEKQALGTSTPFNVIQQQRDLTAAQSAVIAAEVTWSNARVALDQAVGTTLETNHVSMAEARTGRVAQAPTPPPAQP